MKGQRSLLSDVLAISGLQNLHCVNVGRKCRLILVLLDALRAGRQAFNEDAGDAVLDERCPGADADHRRRALDVSPGVFLKRERPVVVVGQVGAGPRPAGRLEQLLSLVLAVVQHDVPGERLAQVFEQARAVPVLRVDEQVVLVGQRFARPRVDRVRPGANSL